MPGPADAAAVGVEMAPVGPDVATHAHADTNKTTPGAPGANNGDVEIVSPAAYLDFLRKFRHVWREQPDVTISFKDLAYTVRVPVTDTKVHNLVTAVVDMAKRPFQGSSASVELKALQPSTGLIKPGTMTLVLAPPGHGKTTLLKALSGRLSHDKALSGTIKYNNRDSDENLAAGVHVSRLCSYVGQSDLLFPVLTVNETLTFAAQSSLPDARLLLEDAKLTPEDRALIEEVIALEPRRAEMLTQLLGLSECSETVVGNDLLRGVSGGQRKRVGLGEMLLTNARAFFLDEVSTGLDAAVTLHIFSALKQWCAINNSSVVVALLQPTPETYALFDDVVLMRDGNCVFHGPREEVSPWLWDVAGLEVPHGVDEAGFVVDYLNDPTQQYKLAEKLAQERLEDVNGIDGDATPEQSRARAASAAKSHRLGARRSSAGASRLQAPEVASSPLAASSGPPMTLTLPIVTGSGNEAEPHTPSHVRMHSGADDVDEKDNGAPPAAMNAPVVAPSQPAPAAPATDLRVEMAPSRAKALRTMASSSFAPQYHSRAGGSPVYDSDELFARYQSSPYYQRLLAECSLAASQVAPIDPSGWNAYTRATYLQRYPHSSWRHTSLNLGRQTKLTLRNKTMIPPRIAQAIIMGVVFGTLFIQLAYDKFADRMGLLLYIVMAGAFSNLTELPVASEARNVVSKQIDAGFFPSASYTISVSLLHIPITLVECLIFALFLYWIPGFVSDAGRFFFFLLVLVLNSNAVSVLFRSISYVAKNPDIARQMDLPFIVIFIIFGGFLITFDKIPNWLLFLYYGSPFGWSVRSLAQNEFLSSKYDHVDPVTGIRDGDAFLSSFGVFTDPIWKWMGVLYLGAVYLGLLVFNAILLNSIKPVTPMGTRKTPTQHVAKNGAMETQGQVTGDAYANTSNATTAVAASVGGAYAMPSHQGAPAAANANGVRASSPVDSVRVSVGEKRMGKQSKQSFQLSALPFVPVTLAWKNINYSVEVGKGKEKHERMLLNDISGYAAPGQMTALMGSSGAGKTTLMDCIAGRKTTGKLVGDILVNGHLKNPTSFNRLTGYVEQQDIHIGTATVREALLFSAKLRLPVNVDQAAREKFVDEVMHLVGLSHIRGRLIGDAALPGLSQGQLKLVTIAVELVANPSVIFLDEPTSGLDAPSAARVMKAVKRIAATGRTVLCTIHQPSEELFLMFDRLLLLKSGGRDVYFGDLGRRGNTLVSYFEEASGYTELLPRGKTEILPDGKKKVTLRISPANWMLDVIGAAGQTETVADYAAIWRDSQMYKEQAVPDMEAAAAPAPGSQPVDLKDSYVSGWTRYKEVQYRLHVSHWRNAPMNVTRFILLLGFAIVLGVVYLQMDISDFGGVSSYLSVIFLGLSFPSSIAAGSALPTFFRQRAAYYRETTIGLYGYKIFNATIFFAELPYLFICVALFITPFYFMVGFQNDADLFFRFFFMSFLMCLLYSSLSTLWLALLPNQIGANVVNGLVSNLFFMFGGMFIKPSSMPIGWKWFYYIDPVPKSFTAVAMGQLYCDSSVPGNTCPMIQPSPNSAPVYTYEYMADSLEANVGEYGEMVGWLFLEIAVVRIFVLLALKYVSHIKR